MSLLKEKHAVSPILGRSLLALGVLLVIRLGAMPADAAPSCTVRGTQGNDVLTGGSGPDMICGRAGDDVLRGLGGDDELLGGDGAGVLEGGAGNDALMGPSATSTRCRTPTGAPA